MLKFWKYIESKNWVWHEGESPNFFKNLGQNVKPFKQKKIPTGTIKFLINFILCS